MKLMMTFFVITTDQSILAEQAYAQSSLLSSDESIRGYCSVTYTIFRFP